ncbi:MAG: hypothetical protein V1817_01945 [Candidatus Micrarchaeota archaeon]
MFDYAIVAGLLLFFAIGVLSRFTDAFECDKRYAHFTLAAAVAYGFGGGILAAASPAFAAVVFGIVLGVLLGGKIDSRQHGTAVGVLFLTALLLNTAPLFLPLVCFTAAAFLDEDLHELTGKLNKRNKPGKAKRSLVETILGSRVLLEASSLVLSAITGNWIFFGAVFAFDAGCYFVPKLANWFPEH